jgi:hypothetical protein
MGTTADTKGRVLQCEAPDWRPLARAVGVNFLGAFMWMFEVTTPAGQRIHAYKHIDTRRYLHLGCCGEAFLYVDEDRYRRVDLAPLLELAFEPWWRGPSATPEDVVAAWTSIEPARR